MKTRKAAARTAGLAALALALGACGRPAPARPAHPPGTARQAPAGTDAETSVPASAPAAAPALAPLCDAKQAGRFQALAKATIQAIDAGRGPETLSRITELEGAWDDREAALRPGSPATWRVLDETLDRAIAAIRGSRTDLPRGRAALVELIAELDRATSRAASAPPAAPAARAAPVAAATRPARVYTAADSAPFAALIRETIRLLDAGRTAKAVATLTDLEAGWDAQELALRPRAPATWVLLDDTLDEAIGALRSSAKKDVPAGRAALEDLLGKLEQATLPAAPSPGSAGPLQIRDTYLPGGANHWDALTVDPAARRLYVSNSTRVVVLDADTGAVVGEVADTPHVHGIALVPERHLGFTSNGGDGTVSVFDLRTFETIRKVPAGRNPDAILYDPASRKVYAFNGRSGDATIIDPAESAKPPATLAIGGKLEFGVADGLGRIYLNVEDQSEVAVIDTAKPEVVARWPLAPGAEPTGVAIDVAHHRLFVGCHNAKMIVLDTRSGKVLADVAVGQGVDGAAFDQGLVMIPNGRDGTLTVVRAAPTGGFPAVQTLPTAKGARTIAADPSTHRAYLPCMRPGKDGRPTFGVLVVGPGG
jgi:DNA-binding beta-propeller fold protein YncE